MQEAQAEEGVSVALLHRSRGALGNARPLVDEAARVFAEAFLRATAP